MWWWVYLRCVWFSCGLGCRLGFGCFLGVGGVFFVGVLFGVYFLCVRVLLGFLLWGGCLCLFVNLGLIGVCLCVLNYGLQSNVQVRVDV